MNTNLFNNAFSFFRLFQKQAGTLGDAVKKLDGLFRDFKAVPDQCKYIDTLVAAGDMTCREIERELSLTFIESIDREDIRDLNRAFEQAFQAVHAVSSRVGLYGFRSIEKGAGELAFCLAEMAAEIGPLLEIVVRKGNGAANRERIRKLKEEAGMFLLVGLGAVYESAGGSVDHLLEAMKWSQIYDRLEDAVSCLEHTANVIERMIQKKV
ncbi:MAG: hypothetical protein NT011_00180 [Kiritimatiellaeota bacterium]|nr:hypothetical protein [Kiritimatiellota bacterium]